MTEYYRYVGKSTVAIEVEVEWETLIPVGVDGEAAERLFAAAARNAAAPHAPFDVNEAKVTKREASRREVVVARPTEPRQPDWVDRDLDSAIRGIQEQR